MRHVLLAALLTCFSVPALASEKTPPAEDEDTCLNEAVCVGVGSNLPRALEEPRTKMRVVMALLPMGPLYVPDWFLEEQVRPPWKGGLKRTSLLHGLGPCAGFGCVPPLGLCTGPMGSVLGMVVGPVVLAIVGGIAGFVIVPVGGTILGICGGGVVGLVAGFLMGGVLGVTLGPLALCAAAAGPLAFWQVAVAPATVMHAYRKAFDLQPPPAPKPLLPDVTEPAPRTPAPPAPPPPSDEGVTVK
jgi:hypothetical protein